MSLWAEHLGGVDSVYEEPENVECVRTVNQVAKNNWKNYTSDEFSSLQGHLLKYPIEVDREGKVGPLPAFENFPDTCGKVL